MEKCKIHINDIYEVKYWAYECPHCGEEVQIDSKHATEWICENCGIKVEIER